ncbi:MAG: hypothetical protein ACR2MB_16650 [Acidimicrobiales bacterium]
MPSDPLSAVELDELVEQITVDAYGDEACWSFLQAFEDEVAYPFPATLVGMAIEVTGVDFDGNERRRLVAQVQRNDRQGKISILDIELPQTGTPASVTLAAYQRWLGII